MIKKKRTTLDSLLNPNTNNQPEMITPNEASDYKKGFSNNQINAEAQEIVRQTVYLPGPVHEQLRLLAFEERRKMHDYLLEGLDLVFKARGLKSLADLKND